MVKEFDRIDPWGRAIVTSGEAFDLLYAGLNPPDIFVVPDEAVARYNALCDAWDKPGEALPIPVTPEEAPEVAIRQRAARWFIPPEYAKIDLEDYLRSRCQTGEQHDRVEQELAEFERRDLLPLLRAMVYLVDTFRANKIVWGVGRGSSVASYVLFLIGIHKIDSLRYRLDIGDFLKPG